MAVGKPTRYLVLVDGKPGAYGIVIPDLPGCCAAGATLELALANARMAALKWTDACKAKRRPVPAPRDEVALLADPDVQQSLNDGAALHWVMVESRA